MMRSCCLFTIVNGFQARRFIGTDNGYRVLDTVRFFCRMAATPYPAYVRRPGKRSATGQLSQD
ncbi:TPA: hypothetical protein ONC52_001510 [Enterobacter asburiae]|jgi:hypothetical protein|nr:hypothetical protein [Enterobacter asburiae]HCR2009707.1 hypothetical protein [Enterobacter asburiae]